jgi:hypothetical protein
MVHWMPQKPRTAMGAAPLVTRRLDAAQAEVDTLETV